MRLRLVAHEFRPTPNARFLAMTIVSSREVLIYPAAISLSFSTRYLTGHPFRVRR